MTAKRLAGTLLLVLGTGAAGEEASAAAAAAPASAAPLEEGPPELPPTLADRIFDVWIDDMEVGEHSFRFTGEPTDFRVDSEASFRVKIAFVTVFRYEHEATEVWRDGCMVSVDSTTESGEDFRVRGEASAGGFSMDTGDGGQTYDVDCPWGFAYWNPGMRDRTRLINPQDGKLFEVQCLELEPQPLSVGGRSVRARTWSLSGEDLDITLYYDDEDRWIGLDSAVGERMLRYRPARDDPFYPG